MVCISTMQIVAHMRRDQELATLSALLSESACGNGRIAVIRGEAGIGKTSRRALYRRDKGAPSAFHTAAVGSVRGVVYATSACGPLYDIAQQTGSPFRALLEVAVGGRLSSLCVKHGGHDRVHKEVAWSDRRWVCR
jgi:hypothetical protein